MKAPRTPNGGYEVGYRRPPVAKRFKPGESGNAKGRPKGVKNASAILRDALMARVKVVENGRTRTMTKLELAFHSAANAAARGDLRALKVLYDLAGQGGDPTAKPASTAETLSPDDEAIMQNLLQRYGAPVDIETSAAGGASATSDTPAASEKKVQD